MSELVKLTGLWKNTTKNGDPILSGYLGAAKVLILKNRDKQGEKDHDYILFITPAPPKKPKESTAPTATEESSEDVPF
ncbi:MAG: hypothetical protein RDV48_04570 [Candidatus Eremiobacteraeota bacterium]|nr:hypothetical protein [Candidatus Eremiobacteraeota bacterium]